MRLPEPLCIVLFVLVQAQASAAPLRTFEVESYGLEEGLAQSSVISFLEDDNGFLWFGTQEGLHRFDGHRFDVLRRQVGDADSLISSTIDVLKRDQRGRMWLGSNDAGVEVIDPVTLERWRVGSDQGLSHPRIIDILPRSDGTALVATAAGVDRVDPDSGSVRALRQIDGLIGLEATVDGGWLAAGRDCRIARNGAPQASPLDTVNSPCVALVRDADGRIWIATEGGQIAELDAGGEGQVRWHDLTGEHDAVVTTAHADVDGRLLLGYADGTVADWLPGGSWARWRIDFGSGAVLSFHRDRGGVLWIGTKGGGLHRVLPLSTALGSEAIPHSAQEYWPSRLIWAIHRDDSRWMIGTDAGLVWRARGATAWSTLLEGVAVRSAVSDRDGGYWLGTHQGLWRWQPPEAPERFERDRLPDPRITDLAWFDGRLWIATRGGLAVLDGERLRPDAVPEALSRRFLTTLTAEAEETLWVGSNEFGVFRLDPESGVRPFFAGDARRSTESIWAIHVTGEHVWLGSFGGGLLQLDESGRLVRQITEDEGLPNNVVYRIVPGWNGRLWMSTNRGLGVFDPDTGRTLQLGRRDGLRSREYNAGAAWRDTEGQLYFGGVNGVDVVDSRAFPLDSPAARPVFAGLTVGQQQIGLVERFSGLDRALPHATRLELDHRQRIFSLRMVALDFNAPSAARLRYRVEGLHDDWIEVHGGQAEFSVNYIAPGEFRLEVAAAGRDGAFGDPRTLHIAVAPPPWRHPWALFGYGLGAAGLALLLAWRIWRGFNARQHQVEELNRLVAARTAELEDLNQRLQQTNRQLRRAMHQDPLTRVSNRRDFDHWVRRRLRAKEQASWPLQFFMIDIDNFKQINDRLGHAIGDQVLVAFAERLRAFCRQQDMLVRWGGEEFLLVTGAMDTEAAASLAERICRSIAGEPLVAESGSDALGVTCSVGFAPCPFGERGDPADWELSIILADRALYAAKAAGKDRWQGVLPGPATDGQQPPDLSRGQTLDELERSGRIERVYPTPA